MRSDKNKKKKKNKEQVTATVNADGTVTQKKKHRLNKKQFFKFILLFILVCILAVAVWVGVIIAKAPKIDTSEIYSILSESTIIYDADGKEIDTIFSEQNRSNVKYKEIPENLINAFIALEDKTFETHHGFNFIRIMGAIKEKIFGGGQISGTSTITQQVARNLFIPDEKDDHSMKRKIVEAYYTLIMERNMTKEQIMEAYLNTIYFGYGSYGVEAAAQAYFSKDLKDLTLAQCAALAALPQQPNEFQLVEMVNKNDVSPKNKNIIKRATNYTFIANDASKDRREICLDLMLEQGYISQEDHDKAIKVTLKKMLDPTFAQGSAYATYFSDYVIEEVINDLMEKKDWSYDTAYERVYNGGLKIYSTLDAQAQSVIEKEFEDSSNFPSSVTWVDSSTGNILDSYGRVAMYDYDNYFDKDGNFTFTKKEIIKKKDGSLIIKANKRLNLYETTAGPSLEFKTLYTKENGTLYGINGGFINIPENYKSINKNGNLVVSAEFFEEYPKFFIFNDNGTITIPPESYTLEQKVIQPQAAMTIVENSTGHIKAMVGGRKTSGRMLHNRAISPRQPGSSMKPLAVYSAAIQQSAAEASSGETHNFIDYNIDKQGVKYWGKYLTAGSTVIDEKTTMNGKVWPQNAGGGYSGTQTMRSALQQSINTCAVKILLQVGETYSANLVKKFGISTIVTDGEANDLNPAALALGGMTRGVTTLEMASAYTTFPNNGTRKDTTSYTKVLDNKGNTLLSSKSSKSHQVLDAGVAWIMQDMLKSVVYGGLGSPASISGVQVGGKTGTTDQQFDIWFDGFTPNYSASLWIGNDVNIQLTEMSGPAARLWGKIMNQIDNAKTGSYKGAPSNVTRVGGEYYISGTYGGASKPEKKTVSICTETGYLATPDCPHTKKKSYDTFADDEDDSEVPEYYCYKHNSDTKKYPISPNEKLEPQDPVLPPKDPEDPEDPDPENPDPENPDPENPSVEGAAA
ncbi:penicillin-binding protein 1A [Clostridiales Family XIII bacterium PM5-7]